MSLSGPNPRAFSPYFATADACRVRAAFAAAGHLEGHASISELIGTATLKEVRRLQRRHNNGKPWEPIRREAPAPGAAPKKKKPATGSNAE
ncbi:hypothetical protein AHiyo8_pI69800 (plasmid) [Arthrobacter sp. Hiyo8]|nr:hypothetical protein AHiyo8_pI69800 [Arthrobacter sp. Hiyo8]